MAIAEFSIFFVYFGAGLALLFSAMELIKQDRPRALTPLFCLGLVTALIQLRLGMFLSGFVPANPWWLLLFFTGLLAFGPVSMKLVLDMAAFAFPNRPNRLWMPHLAAPGIAACVELTLYFQGGEVLGDFYRSALNGTDFQGADWLFLASAIYLTALAGYYLVLFFSLARRIQLGHRFPHAMLLFIPGAGQLLVHIGIFTGNTGMAHVGAAAITVFMVMIFLFQTRYPGFLKTVKKELERYERTRISESDLPRVTERLEQAMSAGRHRDEDLRLGDLAKELELSSNQLSRILNERYKMNFNEFINSYRIADAREMLKREPKRTILSIAYEVGFRSKSAFNAQFLRREGMTPARYRRNHSA